MRPTELEPYKEEAWCGVRCSDGHGGGCVAVGEAGCRVEEYEGVMSGLGSSIRALEVVGMAMPNFRCESMPARHPYYQETLPPYFQL